MWRVTNLPKELTYEFTGFQKEAYYYSAQLKEYKDMLNDPVQLHVSPLTVETHRRNLMQKFNVKSMTAAVKVAMDMGLLG